jgi:hypothetical protein
MKDVEKIFPEVVHHKKLNGSDKDYYTINYSAFGILAIRAIQEQQKKIQEQEQTNKKQQIMIENLQSDLEELKKSLRVSSAVSSQSSFNISKTQQNISSARLSQMHPIHSTIILLSVITSPK